MSSARKNSEDHIVTPHFVLLFISNFVVVCVYFLLMTTMAYYAVNSYGVESSLAGLTASIFLVGGVLGRVVSGRFASPIGPKTLGVVSLIVQVVMCALYLVIDAGIVPLIAIRFIHGLAFGIANTVLPALAIESLPPARIGEGTGYFMLSSSLGVGIGPLMTVLIVMGFDYQLLFCICLALSVVSLVTLLLAKSPVTRVRQESQSRQQAQASGAAGIFDMSTFIFSVFMFIVAFAYSSLNAFINSYAIEFGMGMFAPFVFLVYSVTLIITRLFTGRLQDRFGSGSVLYPSIASMGVGLILAAFVSNPLMLLLCGVFMATGFGTCMSVGQAAALKLSTCNDSSRTISTFFLLCDSGCGSGPFVLGFVVSGAGYQAMYMLCAAIAFCAVAYFHFVYRHRSTGNRDNETSEA